MNSSGQFESTLQKRVCEQCGLEYLGQESPCPHGMEEESDHGSEKLIGTILADHYEILSLIGEGGMSAVYKARHNLMNRIVAIKMMHKHLVSQSTTIKRFQQEAIAVSQLSHPNIIAVHDFGLTADVQPYLVMDYLEGVSLSDLLLQTGGSLPLSRAMKIFEQICDALGHAHSKGVIHRDLKPSNVMLLEHHGEADFVKIVDFGIAKLTISAQQEGQHLTRTGEIFGSPLYMSPEQCMGQSLGPRSDIYSMGCVMYEVLIGQPPFRGNNMLETMYMRLTENAPSFGAVRQDIRIPPVLEAVVFKAMAPEVKHRYESMEELGATLKTALGQSETQKGLRAVMPRATVEIQKFVLQRKRLSPRMLIGIIAALTVVGGFLSYKAFIEVGAAPDPNNFQQQLSWQEYQREAQQFIDEEKYREAEGKLLAAVKEAETLGESDPRLMNSLELLCQVYDVQGKRAEVDKTESRIAEIKAQNPVHDLGKANENLDVIDAALSLVPKQLKKEDWAKYHDLTAKINQWAAICTEKKDYVRAEDLYKRELDIERQTLSPDSPEIAQTLTALASLYHLNEGRYELAGPLYREALQIREKRFGKEHQEVAAGLSNLALLLKDQGKYADAAKLYEQALHIYGKTTGLDRPEAAQALEGLAEVDQNQGRYDEAEKLYRKVIAIDEDSPGSTDRSLAASLHNLAGILVVKGQYGQAEPLYRRALATYEKVLGPDDPQVATILNNLAVVLLQEGKFREAEPLFKRALAIRTRILSPYHPEIAQSLNSLGEVFRDEGRYDEAEPLLKQALEINEKTFGKEHPEVASVLNGLGQLESARGNYEEAERYLNQALALREKELGKDHPSTARSLHELAVVHLKQGKLDKAREEIDRALVIREKTLGKNHPDTLATRNVYADYLIASNHLLAGLQTKAEATIAGLNRAWFGR